MSAVPGYRVLAPGEMELITALKIDLAGAMLKALNDTRMHVTTQRAAQQRIREIGKQRAILPSEAPALGITIEPERFARDSQGRAGLTYHECKALFERADAEIARIEAAQPERWIAIANTHMQEALMALVRAVAQPGGF